ncbi:MAG: hypothetical protein F6K00_02370 [Leptolyngbya sp. SIOISBB]|nr:hypothetical protein [Leptolyngbya sp. SIOISBB]
MLNLSRIGEGVQPEVFGPPVPNTKDGLEVPFFEQNSINVPNIPEGKAVKVEPQEGELTQVGAPMTPEQALRAVDNGANVYTPDRETAREIAGTGAVGPEAHTLNNEQQGAPHFHRRSKSNSSHRGGHGRKGGHIFYGP